MDLKKADYNLVVQLGTMEDFREKLRMDGKSIRDVVDTVDSRGVSLLEDALISRKFDIARALLDANAKVNVITKEGNNELQLLAARIREEGALEIAWILLERGVSLLAVDRKYGNNTLFTLCYEIFKVRSEESMRFLDACLERAPVPALEHTNRAGYSVRRVINERGSERQKQIVEEKIRQGGEENIDAVYYVRPGDGGPRMKKRTAAILALVLAAILLLGVALLVRAVRRMEEDFAARQGRMQAFLDAVAAHDYEEGLPLMQPALGMDAVSWLREATAIKKDYNGFAEGAVFKECTGMGKSMRKNGRGWHLERRYTCLYEAGGEDYLVEFVFVELDGVDGIYNISIEPLEG